MKLMYTFEDALAQALDRCSLGETPETVADAFPEYDLLPYLRLAERIHVASTPEPDPSRDWMERSLQRLLRRTSECDPRAE